MGDWKIVSDTRRRTTDQLRDFRPPDRGDIRVFATGLARWSGTSFAAPVVAGLIAREISRSGLSASEARDAVLARARYASDPMIGPYLELRQPEATRR